MLKSKRALGFAQVFARITVTDFEDNDLCSIDVLDATELSDALANISSAMSSEPIKIIHVERYQEPEATE